MNDPTSSKWSTVYLTSCGPLQSLCIQKTGLVHRQLKHGVSIYCGRLSRFLRPDFVSEQISSSQNRCKLVQTAQIQFNYLSCCSLVSFLYILGPLETIWTGFSFQSFPYQEKKL